MFLARKLLIIAIYICNVGIPSLFFSFLKTLQVVAAQVEDINFVKPSSSSKLPKVCQPPKICHIAPPTEEELAEFHASLSSAPSRPVIHRVMDEFAHEFIPMAASEKYPPAMSSLYDPDSLGLTYPELLTKCSELADSLKVSHCVT